MTITESEVRAILALCDKFDPAICYDGERFEPLDIKALCESWLRLRDVARIAKSYVNLRAEDFQVRGELFRDLAKSLEALANKDTP